MILKKHLSHYFSLIGILVATIVGFLAFPYDSNFHFAVMASCSLGYFTWGIIHHYLHKDLSTEIIIEYAMIAVVGFVIGISVIFRT